jgi:hypothetical protein
VVTNKSKSPKKKRKLAFNFLFWAFAFSKRSFGGPTQRSAVNPLVGSSLSIFFFGLLLFQSGALEARRSAAQSFLS